VPVSLTRTTLSAIALVVSALNITVGAAETQLEDCLETSTRVCSDSPRLLVEDECGPASYRYVGRISWPPLRSVGPVTIGVQTRADPFTLIPLYVEVRGLSSFSDTTACRTGLGAELVLEIPGGASCGGTWTTIGPVDLRPHGVSLGELYLLQLMFFQTVPFPTGQRGYSPGVSCVRVTTSPAVITASTWTSMKLIHR
jgi:hypothetical protein